MIITTNIPALPLVLLLWFLDAWVALLAARLVLQHIPAVWASRICAAVAPFTDPLLSRTHRWSLRLWPRLTVSWIGVIVLIVCLVLKQILLRILIGAA